MVPDDDDQLEEFEFNLSPRQLERTAESSSSVFKQISTFDELSLSPAPEFALISPEHDRVSVNNDGHENFWDNQDSSARTAVDSLIGYTKEPILDFGEASVCVDAFTSNSLQSFFVIPDHTSSLPSLDSTNFCHDQDSARVVDPDAVYHPTGSQNYASEKGITTGDPLTTAVHF